MKSKGKVRPYPKGRPVDAGALEEVRVLLGDEPRRRDLLIEHLHKINDRYGHLSAAHLAALAQEMALSQTEVYEVATFYHHFEVVKEGEAPPPSLTVRVCDSIACELAGADALLERLPSILGKDVRVVHAPCVGRCEVAPVAGGGQNPVGHATVDTVKKAVEEKQVLCAETRYIDFAAYKKGGGYKLISDCLDGKHTREALTKIMEASGLRGLGGVGAAGPGGPRLPGGPKGGEGGRRARAAPDGGQHRRGGAGHLQGPLVPRARSAPLPGRHAGRRLGGGHRRDLHLPAGRE